MHVVGAALANGRPTPSSDPPTPAQSHQRLYASPSNTLPSTTNGLLFFLSTSAIDEPARIIFDASRASVTVEQGRVILGVAKRGKLFGETLPQDTPAALCQELNALSRRWLYDTHSLEHFHTLASNPAHTPELIWLTAHTLLGLTRDADRMPRRQSIRTEKIVRHRVSCTIVELIDALAPVVRSETEAMRAYHELCKAGAEAGVLWCRRLDERDHSLLAVHRYQYFAPPRTPGSGGASPAARAAVGVGELRRMTPAVAHRTDSTRPSIGPLSLQLARCRRRARQR